MIASSHAIAIGYHGCDRSIGKQILEGRTRIRRSTNSYDWLGHGAYFWESNELRAREWAQQQAEQGKIREPFVVGAVISLGRCLDLTSGDALSILKPYHQAMVEDFQSRRIAIPRNRIQASTGEWLLRELDCAVIEFLHQARKSAGVHEYSSVRGVFFEGHELYPGSGFRERNHIQICIRDLSTILGTFRP